MTYCLGLKVDDGFVLASDSRTNAGVDYVSVYSKMTRFELGPGRVFVIVTSGNLATSQAVIQQLRRDIEVNAPLSLASVPTVYDAATYLGLVNRQAQGQHAQALMQNGISGEANFIIGGEIEGRPHDLYLVYAQGNCIYPSAEAPFLQIGETKYGKPILDRVIRTDTSLEDCARAAMVSLDSTMRSNITVGPPVELAIVRRGTFAVSHYMKLAESDMFYGAMTRYWGEGLREVFHTLPRFPWEGAAYSETVQAQFQTYSATSGPAGLPDAAQSPEGSSQHSWNGVQMG